jgi:ketosteroid isomerase-like protein
MKTTFSLLALLLISAGAFAQTNLTDEFPAIMKARNADAKAFFEARTTPDMVFIAGHDGSVQNKDWLMGLFKTQKSQTAEITNLNIQQTGDLAVATGISTITAIALDGGKTSTYKDAFTYTLRWMNGQWMFTNLHHTKIEYR